MKDCRLINPSNLVIRNYSDLPVEPIDPHSNPSSSVSTIDELLEWRIYDRIKTVAAGLTLCLNLGIDPPDCNRPSPCASWECWIDPATGIPVERCGNVPEDENLNLAGNYNLLTNP